MATDQLPIEGEFEPPAVTAIRRLVPCRIGERLFAVPVEQAGDVVILSNVVPVAFAPPIVSGVLNQHGRMATVVEAGMALGVPPGQTSSRVGLTVEHDGHLYILSVDEVREITALDDAQKEIAPLDIGAIIDLR